MSVPLEVMIKRTASNRSAVSQLTKQAERDVRSEINSLKNLDLHIDLSKYSSTLKPFVAPVAGFIAAFAEISLLFPTEYAKTQLQLNRKNKEFNIWKHLRERKFTIYQALPPMLIGAPLQGLLRFACLDAAQKSSTLKNLNSPTLQGLVAGVAAGIVESVLVVTPMETLKTKLIDSKKGLLSGIKLVLETQGVGGFYRGVGATIAKSASNQAIRFVVFGKYKEYLLKKENNKDSVARSKLTPGESLFGGVLAGLIGIFLNTPVDTIKSRMQSMDASRYKSSIDCAVQMIKNEGFLSLYKGLLMRSARVVPGQGIIFLVYEQASARLNKAIGI